MIWQQIHKQEISSWNKKLKDTNASFFQYPYYASGYSSFFRSKAVYLKLLDELNEEKGFCTILEINLFFLKIGLIIRGPVIFQHNNKIAESLDSLKKYAAQKKYSFLRINPNDIFLEKVLQKDISFVNKNFFPIYNGSQNKDFNVYPLPKDDLLKSFRTDCRNKIRFASEINFKFSEINSENELKKMYADFKQLGKKKGFSYRPYKSYKIIYENGLKENLCSVYTATFENEIICSIFMVKDALSYNCLSGAMILKKDLKAKYSPANKLHYTAMQDCFYKEQKAHYNLSYSSPDTSVYMFKNSFHPVVEEKPGYYTYVIKKRASDFLLSMQQNRLKKIKSFFRNASNFFKK